MNIFIITAIYALELCCAYVHTEKSKGTQVENEILIEKLFLLWSFLNE